MKEYGIYNISKQGAVKMSNQVNAVLMLMLVLIGDGGYTAE